MDEMSASRPLFNGQRIWSAKNLVFSFQLEFLHHWPLATTKRRESSMRKSAANWPMSMTAASPLLLGMGSDCSGGWGCNFVDFKHIFKP
jgi:hypothetical protein